MNTIVVTIIVGIVVFVLTSIASHISKKYFICQPKVHIRFVYRGGHSSLDWNNEIRIAWNYDIIFENQTKYDAISIDIDFNSYPSQYITKQKFSHLKGLSEETLKLHFYKTYNRSIVEKSNDRFSELMPVEFSKAMILLTYSNEMNKNFYTMFIKNGNLEKNVFYKFKPKFDNYKDR